MGRNKDAPVSSAKLPNRSNFPAFCGKKKKKTALVRYSVATPIALCLNELFYASPMRNINISLD